jgi:thioredoxin-related protein
MKTFLFLLPVFFLNAVGEWMTDFELARQEAKQNSKMILLNFSGSDWCAPCIKMKKDIFEQSTFQTYAKQSLVLVRADFPRSKKNQLDSDQKVRNEKLAEKYNPQGKFPLTLLLNSEGKVIYMWDGLPAATVDDFIKQIDQKAYGK